MISLDDAVVFVKEIQAFKKTMIAFRRDSDRICEISLPKSSLTQDEQDEIRQMAEKRGWHDISSPILLTFRG
jgi:hypothetical protein